MKVHSLSRRVLSIVLAAQMICAVLLSGFALLHEQHTRLRAFDESLKGRSDSVLGAIQDSEDKDNSVAIDVRELKLPAGDAYRVYGSDGGDLGGTADAPLTLAKESTDGFRDERVRGTVYRIYQRSGLRIIDRAETGGVGRSRAVVILYASSKRHLEHEIVEAAGVYTSIILLVVLGTGGLVIVMVRQALQPLQDLAGAAEEVSVPALRFEPPASVLQLRELRPLADVLNELISKLREAFTKERRFVGDAAHELKTAVAVVRSTVQLMMVKPRTNNEYILGLDRVVEDIGRVETLVAQMLSSSEADNESPATFAPLLLGESAAEVLAAIEPFAESRQVQLTLDQQSGAVVRLRKDRAAALISNLVLNAVQHSERGMLVRTVIEATPQGWVVLKVTDTGSGIEETALPHVFERFYREDRSRSRETGGAGLGLAICKSIVESAGGEIVIQSRQGAGTTVTVTFMNS